MHCLTCHEEGQVDDSIKQKNVYIAGTDNLKVTVEYYEFSTNHQKKIVIGRNNPNKAPAMKMIHGLNTNTSKLKHIFITTHYITVQCRPIRDYVSLR